MTIYVDSSEQTTNSLMPFMEDAVTLSYLEDMTGADILITPLIIPMTEGMLDIHIKEGALLIQRKQGLDLPNSIIDGRLPASLSKMREAGARQYQCCLLFIGLLDFVHGTANAYINKKETGLSYDAIDTALCRWNDRGGVIHRLLTKEEIPDWLRKREKHLKEYIENPQKLLWQKKEMYGGGDDNPFQTASVVRDFRILLTNLPGIGEKKANELWEFYKEDVLSIFFSITDFMWTKTKHPMKGIGPKTIMKIRDFFGLENEGDSALQFSTHWVTTSDNKKKIVREKGKQSFHEMFSEFFGEDDE